MDKKKGNSYIPDIEWAMRDVQENINWLEQIILGEYLHKS
jgi:hypothetical protein